MKHKSSSSFSYLPPPPSPHPSLPPHFTLPVSPQWCSSPSSYPALDFNNWHISFGTV